MATGEPSRLVNRNAVLTAAPAIPRLVASNDATGASGGRSREPQTPSVDGLSVGLGAVVGRGDGDVDGAVGDA